MQVVFPVNWRDHFMINKGSVATADTPEMYPMPYTNNNNYNLICEKYGFKKGISGWNLAKLVMRKLPSCVPPPHPRHAFSQLLNRAQIKKVGRMAPIQHH